MPPVLRKILWPLRKLWGLPGDIDWWVKVGIPGMPTVMAWIAAYLRDAPIWITGLVILVGFFFFYGLSIPLIRQTVHSAKRADEKRAALADLLGVAHERGGALRGQHSDKEARKEWEQRTYDLIEAALGKGKARSFSSYLGGYTVENLIGFDIAVESRLGYIASGNFWLDTRIRRLEELIAQLDSLTIRPDFDPQDWMGEV